MDLEVEPPYRVMVDGFELYQRRFHTLEAAEQEAAEQRRWSSVSDAWVETLKDGQWTR